jgi:pilus assembly protein FimV
MPEPAARAAAPPIKPSTTGLSAARTLEAAQRAAAPPAAPPPEKVDTSPPDLPDFSLEVPPAGTGGGAGRATPAASSDFNMDFNLEPLPPIDVPGAEPKSAESPAAQSQSNDLEFKLDDINLDFGGRTGAAAGAGAPKTPRDDHWYDVQQKFDLAKAYEEMGDKAGARDILQEVVKEGDAEQQAQAKKLLSSLA